MRFFVACRPICRYAFSSLIPCIRNSGVFASSSARCDSTRCSSCAIRRDVHLRASAGGMRAPSRSGARTTGRASTACIRRRFVAACRESPDSHGRDRADRRASIVLEPRDRQIGPHRQHDEHDEHDEIGALGQRGGRRPSPLRRRERSMHRSGDHANRGASANDASRDATPARSEAAARVSFDASEPSRGGFVPRPPRDTHELAQDHL